MDASLDFTKQLLVRKALPTKVIQSSSGMRDLFNYQKQTEIIGDFCVLIVISCFGRHDFIKTSKSYHY
jgi:hypothetical protein